MTETGRAYAPGMIRVLQDAVADVDRQDPG